MRKTIISLLIFILLFQLVGCDKNIETTGSYRVRKEIAKEKSELIQEKLNTQLKNEAVKADFVELNSEEANDKVKKVYVEGEINKKLKEDILEEFTLTTKEGKDYGIYKIKNMTLDTFEEGDIIKAWGLFSGKDEMGMPTITAIIIEKSKENK